MKKTVVVLGANRGIGLELCREYLADSEVIALCRKASDELEKLDVKVIEGFDLADDNIGEKISRELKGYQIDIFIHNAGVMISDDLEKIDFNNIRRQFEINTIGPLKIGKALSTMLSSGSKIAFITSRMGSISDNTSGGQYGYRISKSGLNSMAKSLSLDLQNKNIAVGVFHPGYVRTDMTRGSGLINADESAQGLKKVIGNLDLKTTGGFWHSNGECLPW
ncbi:MAG: SDR family oxidoreductase [Bacteriovoracaceae bacterium]|jgi:NAD(P)-dependent dehydrogenase (short-subunit alcohol dehydrogenase family)|nr:SDR family oxidoreductase [Bacteriovoracaceae bacterium]